MDRLSRGISYRHLNIAEGLVGICTQVINQIWRSIASRIGHLPVSCVSEIPFDLRLFYSMPRIGGSMEPVPIHFCASSGPESIGFGTGHCNCVFAVGRVYLDLQRSPLSETLPADRRNGTAACQHRQGQSAHPALPARVPIQRSSGNLLLGCCGGDETGEQSGDLSAYRPGLFQFISKMTASTPSAGYEGRRQK